MAQESYPREVYIARDPSPKFGGRGCPSYEISAVKECLTTRARDQGVAEVSSSREGPVKLPGSREGGYTRVCVRVPASFGAGGWAAGIAGKVSGSNVPPR